MQWGLREMCLESQWVIKPREVCLDTSYKLLDWPKSSFWFFHKNSEKKIESPEINPCTDGWLIYEKEARIYIGGKSISLFNIWFGKTGQLPAKNEAGPHLTTHTKISSKWIKDVNVMTMPKLLTVWIRINCGKFWNRWEYQTTWLTFWEIWMQISLHSGSNN